MICFSQDAQGARQWLDKHFKAEVDVLKAQGYIEVEVYIAQMCLSKGGWEYNRGILYKPEGYKGMGSKQQGSYEGLYPHEIFLVGLSVTSYEDAVSRALAVHNLDKSGKHLWG